MKRYDPLYNDLNMLISFLTGGAMPVDKLMDDFYLAKFGNSAPGELMRQQIQKMIVHLNNAN